MTSSLPPPLSRLPAVDIVLRQDGAGEAITRLGRPRLVAAVWDELARARERVRAGGPVPGAEAVLDAAVAGLTRDTDRRVRRVVDATGVVFHTNLGRAPLSDAARSAVEEAAGYAAVEYDAIPGRRDSRTGYPGALAAELCGAEEATVANNGAAAAASSSSRSPRWRATARWWCRGAS